MPSRRRRKPKRLATARQYKRFLRESLRSVSNANSEFNAISDGRTGATPEERRKHLIDWRQRVMRSLYELEMKLYAAEEA